MKLWIALTSLLVISSTALADVDYGLQIKNGTRVTTTAVAENPVWSIDRVQISAQDQYHSTLEVTATIGNGICGASEVHSKIKSDGETDSADGLTRTLNFELSVVATGPSTDMFKACYTSSSGPVQIVMEVPVWIMSTDPKDSIQYVIKGGKTSFSVTGQWGKPWVASQPK